jgi:uncharacterized phiE125 gp8 family phage protein
MSLRLITAPDALAVSLADMKAWLRVDFTTDDALIEGLITAAVQNIDGRDGWLGRALVQQTWELALDCFPTEIKIPLPPLQSIASIKYDDAGGFEQTVSASDYTVDNAGRVGWVIPNAGFRWPNTYRGANAVRVRFVAGYGTDNENVPAPIKLAIKRAVATHYENRENVVIGVSATPLPGAANALLAPYRVW